ncbi:LamG-like jellyroll fold domain-containing protein, partial [Streptomyces albidoflavus]|uniref:LamG-like jellyroll fold domain-containing protein n=1 Tax=Streptomyces albidoflavus TaxID=1886 RepID=UPI0033243A58
PITATDRQKLLGRDKVRQAIVEQTLATNPRCYYPLGEPAGSQQGGNIAATAQPDLTLQTWNSGGVAEFGTSGGPDGTTGVQFTPTDINNGRFLLTTLTTPLGGVAGISIAAWVNFGATTQTGQNRVIYVDNGTDTVHLRINYAPSTNTLTLGARLSSGSVSGSTTSLNLDDLALHSLVATAEFVAGTMQLRLYVDGTLAINTSPALTGSTWPSLPRIRVGGLPGTALDPPEMMMGLVGHVACWNAVLTQPDAQSLTDAANGFAGELSGARAARIATWAGVTNTAFDTGSSLMDSNPSTEQTPLAAFKQIAFSEGGVFFISADDLVTIHGRNRRQLPPAVSITLAAHQCGTDLQFVMDDQLLINDVSVSRGGHSVTRVVDQSSIDENGGTYTASISTLLYSDTEALDRASYTVTTYGHPQPRAGQISVDAHSLGTVWDQMLAADIGQRIQITGLPSEAPAAIVDLWCEGVEDIITDGTWTFVLDTSPFRDTPVFILDNATYGTLDNNYLGW